MVNLGDHVITPLDVIVERPMEAIGSRIQELYTFLWSYLGYCVVGLFGWNVELVVAHGT